MGAPGVVLCHEQQVKGARMGIQQMRRNLEISVFLLASVPFLRNQLTPLAQTRPRPPHSVKRIVYWTCLLVTVLIDTSESSQFSCYHNK